MNEQIDEQATQPQGTSVPVEDVISYLMARAETDPMLKLHIESATNAVAANIERKRAEKLEAQLLGMADKAGTD